MGGQTYVRTYVVRTDVHDVMAIKPNFLTSMGYHIFLTMVLRVRAPLARAELRYNGAGQLKQVLSHNFLYCCLFVFDKKENRFYELSDNVLSNQESKLLSSEQQKKFIPWQKQKTQ